MASNKTINSALLCGICNQLLKEPRLSQCGHSFCKNCLVEYLNKSDEPQQNKKDEKTKSSLIFRCPKSNCGEEYTIPDTNIKTFPIEFAILPTLEKEEIRQNITVCSKHKKRCKFFCKKCKRELCKNCIPEHEGHGLLAAKNANKEFIEKCRATSQENEKKFQISQEINKSFDDLLNSEENTVVDTIEKSLVFFSTSQKLIAEEEINSVSRTLQEYEFKSPFHERAKQMKMLWPFQEANRILSPILKAPSGKVMEPVLSLELAEFYLQIFDKNPGVTKPKMKGTLSNDFQIARSFAKALCVNLARSLKDSSLFPAPCDKSSGSVIKRVI